MNAPLTWKQWAAVAVMWFAVMTPIVLLIPNACP